MPTTRTKPPIVKKNGWTRIENVTPLTTPVALGGLRYAGLICKHTRSFKRGAFVEICSTNAKHSCRGVMEVLSLQCALVECKDWRCNIAVEGEDQEAEDAALTIYSAFTCKDWTENPGNWFKEGAQDANH
jgi:hypothetical protein